MKMLGLNPMEQEIVDVTNKIVKDGFIYFPEFCQVVQKKFRETDEDLFRQNMFKVTPYPKFLRYRLNVLLLSYLLVIPIDSSMFQILCGTEPFPSKFKAKKYKLHDHFITKKNFFQMMSNLPEYVRTISIRDYKAGKLWIVFGMRGGGVSGLLGGDNPHGRSCHTFDFS